MRTRLIDVISLRSASDVRTRTFRRTYVSIWSGQIFRIYNMLRAHQYWPMDD